MLSEDNKEINKDLKSCKYCKKKFEPYKRVDDCWNGCVDGVLLSERDYGDVWINCPTCKGNGEITITEDVYCSEECLVEHHAESEMQDDNA